MVVLGKITSLLENFYFTQFEYISLEQTAVNSAENLVIGSVPRIARITMLAQGAYWVIREQWSLGSLFAFQTFL